MARRSSRGRGKPPVKIIEDARRLPAPQRTCWLAGLAAAISETRAWWHGTEAHQRIHTLVAFATLAVACNWPLALLSANNARGNTHFNLGYAFDDAGRLDDAIGEYRIAERLVPSDAQVHSNLGVALAATGQHDAAVAEYEEAIRLEPDFAGAHNNLGMALASAGRYVDALVQFDKTVALDPRSAEAHYNRGTVLAALGRSDAAMGEFTETLCWHRPDS